MAKLELEQPSNVLLDFHSNFCAENEALKPRRALNREGFTCSCGDGDVLSCSTSVIFRDKGSNRVCVLTPLEMVKSLKSVLNAETRDIYQKLGFEMLISER